MQFGRDLQVLSHPAVGKLWRPEGDGREVLHRRNVMSGVWWGEVYMEEPVQGPSGLNVQVNYRKAACCVAHFICHPIVLHVMQLVMQSMWQLQHSGAEATGVLLAVSSVINRPEAPNTVHLPSKHDSCDMTACRRKSGLGSVVGLPISADTAS